LDRSLFKTSAFVLTLITDFNQTANFIAEA